MNTPTTSHEPLDSFDLALLAELRAEVVGRSTAQRRSPARRRTLAVAGVAAAAAATFGISSLGSSGAAYAVEQSGGDITITIHRLDDAAGLEKALAADGIKADVSYDASPTIGPAGSSGPALQPVRPGDSRTLSGSGHLIGSAPAAGSASTSTDGSQPGDVCGGLAHPALDARLSGDAYVISIPADSALHRADSELKITTTGALAESVAGISVDYTVNGTTCGMGTASASAVPAG